MAVREIILTAQHSDCAFFSTVRIHKSINKYVHGSDVRIDWCFFLSDKGGSFDLNFKRGHTWKLRKRIYSNTIFTKSKEDSDEKIKA